MAVRGHAGAEGRDRGTATAEFAVVLPALVLLVVVLAGAAAIGFTQLRARGDLLPRRGRSGSDGPDRGRTLGR